MSKTLLRLVSTFVLIALCGTMTRTSAAADLSAPAVVVFPLVASQPSGADAAVKIAGSFADQIAQHGGVTVRPAPAATTGQAGYLAAARSVGADYYVSGYVTKVGDQYSVLVQLVRTRNGFIRWSETVMLSMDDSLISEGVRIHDVILADNGNVGRYPVPPPVQNANPNPVAAAPKPRATPDNAAAAKARQVATDALVNAQPITAPAGARTALIVQFTGQASSDVKKYLPGSFITNLKRYGIVAERSDLTTAQLTSADAPVACAETGATYLIGGTIESREEPPDNGGLWYDAEVIMTAYDCTKPNAKPQIVDYQSQAGDRQTSLDVAVNNVLKKYLHR